MLSDHAIALMEAATDAVIVMDHTGRIAAANRAAEQLFGYSRAELVGDRVERLMPEPARSEHGGYLARYLATGVTAIVGRGREVRALHRDGTTFPAALSVGRIAGSEPPSFVGFLRDLTAEHQARAAIERERDRAQQREAETHRMQARLLAVSRMATMGEMAAGVAHEINQPLTAISNYARACERFIAADPPALADIRDCVQEIVGEARRAADIVRQLRRLGRQDQAERSVADVNDIVQQLQPLLHADARTHDCKLELQLGAQLPPVQVDAVQLQQVLLNLVRNALEALAVLPVGQRNVTITTRATSPQIVEITVRDDGPGVAPGMLAHLFEPFSTTKPSGAGLGLPIGRTIVEAQGGCLTHVQEAGSGACFRIEIPAMEKTST
jgi:two-component system sensor kinase FixL